MPQKITTVHAMKKILISACMLGEKVRYDGKHQLLEHPILQLWNAQGRLVSVCPEVSGGLGVPRLPAEAQCKHPILVVNCEGEDVTPEFLSGAERTLETAQKEHVCCALMKSKSPSCGNQQIYDGSFSGQLTTGQGIAAAELMRHGYPVFNEHQLDQLFDFVENYDH